MEYILGLDAGGTKSHLALFDINGNLVDFGRWGALNHENLEGSFGQFKDEANQFINDLLKKNNLTIGQISSAVFGVAGVDIKSQHDTISKIMREIGFKNFILANDAFLGIPAGSPSCRGICAINGTGCTIVGVNKKGRMFQIGGVGFISNDYGGGGMLGEIVISSVYSEFFRKGEPTCMTPALMDILGIKSKYLFVEKIYLMSEDHSLDIRNLSRLLFDAALKNDKIALDILARAGENYANGISAMIEELQFDKYPNEDLYIVLAGSVFSKGEHPKIIDTIKEKLKNSNPDLKLKYTLLKVPPVAGAVYWAFNNLNKNETENCYAKIHSQLENIEEKM